MIPLLRMDSVQALGSAGIVLVAGAWIKRGFPLLNRLQIPSAIAGGMLWALASLALHGHWLDIEVDSSLRDVLMIACFACIGLTSSLRVLRKGGVQVFVLAALSVVASTMQAVTGMGLAKLIGIDARIGLLAGTVALAGGPSTALAFGPIFESAGVPSATAVALASATFGIVSAGLMAGWTGAALVRRFRLNSVLPTTSTSLSEQVRCARPDLFKYLLLISVVIGLGDLVSIGVNKLGIVLPRFIGAMLVAVVVRNLDESNNWFGIDQESAELCLTLLLPLFIALAMLNLKLWVLAAIALPLLFVLIFEVALTWLFSVLITFQLMGRDFQSAVTTAGFFGFMIGITPNAMASMGEMTRTYGPAPRAFLVVPLVGAFILDLANSFVISIFSNLFR